MRHFSELTAVFLLLVAASSVAAAAKPEDLVGRTASTFSLRNPITGQSISLEGLRGKVVVLDFWATWCGPCKDVLPYIREISRIFKGEDFVAISIDLREDDDTVRKFAQANQMDWLIATDRDGNVARNYDVTAIPTLFIVDRFGVVRYVHVGFFKELRDELIRRITDLLKESSDSITCITSSTSVTVGDSLVIFGMVVPARATSVALRLTKPDGTSYIVNVVSGADGSYSYRFAPDVPGFWGASATLVKTSSSQVTFEAKEKPIWQTPTIIAVGIGATIVCTLFIVYLLRRRSLSEGS